MVSLTNDKISLVSPPPPPATLVHRRCSRRRRRHSLPVGNTKEGFSCSNDEGSLISRDLLTSPSSLHLHQQPLKKSRSDNFDDCNYNTCSESTIVNNDTIDTSKTDHQLLLMHVLQNLKMLSYSARDRESNVLDEDEEVDTLERTLSIMRFASQQGFSSPLSSSPIGNFKNINWESSETTDAMSHAYTCLASRVESQQNSETMENSLNDASSKSYVYSQHQLDLDITTEELAGMYLESDTLVCAITDEGYLTYCNETWFRLFGYSCTEVIGRELTHFFADPNDQNAIVSFLSTDIHRCTIVMKRHGGSTMPVTFVGHSRAISKYKISSGIPLTLIVALISEQQVNIDGIRDGNHLNGENAFISMHDTVSRFVNISGSKDSILGYDLNQMFGMPFIHLHHPDDIMRTLPFFTGASGHIHDLARIVYRALTASRSWIWLETTIFLSSEMLDTVSICSSTSTGANLCHRAEVGPPLPYFYRTTPLRSVSISMLGNFEPIDETSFSLLGYETDKLDTDGSLLADDIALCFRQLLRENELLKSIMFYSMPKRESNPSEDKILMQRRTQYAALVFNLLHNDIIWVTHTLDGTIRMVSPSVEHVLGYRPDELIGRNHCSLVHPDDRYILLDLIKGMAAEKIVIRNGRESTGIWQDVSFRRLHIMGYALQVTISLHPVMFRSRRCYVIHERLLGGSETELVPSLRPKPISRRDIRLPPAYNILNPDQESIPENTEEISTRDKAVSPVILYRSPPLVSLCGSRALYDILLDEMNDVLLLLGGYDEYVLYCNSSTTLVFGIPPSEMVASTASDTMHPEDYDTLIMTKEREYNMRVSDDEYNMQSKSGILRPLMYRRRYTPHGKQWAGTYVMVNADVRRFTDDSGQYLYMVVEHNKDSTDNRP